MTKKQQKVWAYKVKHPQATTTEIAKATKTSYGYVYKLMQKIGTPKDVSDAAYEMTKNGIPVATPKQPIAVLQEPVAIQKSRSYSRDDILDTAKEYVTKDRAAQHGDMEGNFTRIAEYWSVHLDTPVYPDDVAVMMTLLKVARIKSNFEHPDNWVDGAGYMACGGELATEEALRASKQVE